jgi:hypothetical protein
LNAWTATATFGGPTLIRPCVQVIGDDLLGSAHSSLGSRAFRLT